MAHTASGSWVGGDDWYAWLDASVTNTNNTTCTVTVTGGIYNQWAVASNFTANITSNSSGDTSTYSVGSIYTYSGDKTIQTNYISITRGTSNKSFKVKCTVNGSGDYAYSSSTASYTLTIPAKPSYPVTYDANGGTGAPSNQTKYYGDSLTLSSVIPTRTNYSFAGWNTRADGTGTNYSAGGSYTGNATLTLFAKWTLDYAFPTITNPTIIRCTNASGYPASEEGTYAKLSFGWKFDDHATSGTWSVKWREVGETQWNNDKTNQSLSGNSGTLAFTLLTKSDFDVQTGYQIQLILTDGNDTDYSQSVIIILTQGFAHIVLGGSTGRIHSVGIGKSPTGPNILDVGIGFSHTGGAVSLDSASKAAWQVALFGFADTDWDYEVGSASTISTGSFVRWRVKSGWVKVEALDLPKRRNGSARLTRTTFRTPRRRTPHTSAQTTRDSEQSGSIRRGASCSTPTVPRIHSTDIYPTRCKEVAWQRCSHTLSVGLYRPR